VGCTVHVVCVAVVAFEVFQAGCAVHAVWGGVAASEVIQAGYAVHVVGDDFMILGCDGIWEVLSNQQCVDFVQQKLQLGMQPKEICEAVCDRCLAKNTDTGLGCDNMSVLVVSFSRSWVEAMTSPSGHRRQISNDELEEAKVFKKCKS
ncbi:hypothetical protein CYMTET_32417, partial [Cymbomonas tetramitiformis]